MLPLSKQEMQILLAFMKDCESYFTYDQKWQKAKKISNLHQKLLVNLNRYEEVDEDEEEYYP